MPDVLTKVPQSVCPNGAPHHWILKEAGPSTGPVLGFDATCKKCGATSGPERNHAVADKDKTQGWHPYKLHDYSKNPKPRELSRVLRSQKCQECGNDYVPRSGTQKWCPDCKDKVTVQERKCRRCKGEFNAKRTHFYTVAGRKHAKFETVCHRPACEAQEKAAGKARWQREKAERERRVG